MQTVDVLAPIADDPYTYGKIAGINSLSDVWAMGGRPLSALGIIGFPSGGDPEVMSAILRGGQDAIVEAGAAIVGGHSFASDEIRYGLAITGEIDPREIFTNANAKVGDVLVLTKAIGIGTIVSAAVVRGAIPPHLMDSALQSMLTPNKAASQAMRRHGANSCTDVTGFGLIGHATEMALGSNLTIRLNVSQIPVLPGVRDFIASHLYDPASRSNSNSFAKYTSFDASVADAERTMLFSSETSGGLLISLPADSAERLVSELRSGGHLSTAVIGEVVARGENDPFILVTP